MAAAERRRSLWMRRSPGESFPALQGDGDVDVAVVGGGITGLTAATLLARAGQKVAVVERDHVGAGTSGGTTAHLSTFIDAGYDELIGSMGAAKARRVARSMMRAVDQVEALQQELGIDCAFERVAGYYFAEQASDRKEVEKQHRAAEEAGLTVQLVGEAPLPFPTARAFLVHDQAQLHPVLYLQGLARAIENAGGKVYEGTTVTEVDDGARCTVKTDRGVIRATRVLLATHTPLGVNAVQTALVPTRSFVLAARSRDELPNGLFWDTAEPYNYIRRFSAGEDEPFVVVGGSDHKTGEGSRRSYARLKEYARARFKSLQIEDVWSAQLYESADGLPFIGKSPLGRNLFIATGYSGDGMTFGTLAGAIVANLFTTGADEHAELYGPTRISMAGAKTWLEENVHVGRHLLGDRIRLRRSETGPDLEKGEARVVHHQRGSYLALYRDGDEVQARDAICPHLKCIVQWNPGERSWDCPCHGSRFDLEGRPVDGPATAGLERLDVEQE